MLKKSLKTLSLFVIASIFFSCNVNTNSNLWNKNFKLSANINNETNNNTSLYKFEGTLNKTDKNVYNATLFAGSYDGISGNKDAKGSRASFSYPYQIKCDSKNNIFVIDSTTNIREITPAGTVISLFINTYDGISVNMPLSGKNFVIDLDDNIYVIKNRNILKISTSGVATTIYTLPQSIVSLDRIAVDQDHNVYFTDSSDSSIKKISITGSISIINTTFNYLWDIIPDNNGNLYISDAFSGKIKEIDHNYKLTTFSGSTYDPSKLNNSVDGNKETSKFSGIFFMAFDQNSNNIIVAEGNKIRKVDQIGNVNTLIINNIDPNLKFENGFFDSFYGLTVDHLGNIFVSDTFTHRIFKLTPSSIATSLL